MGRKPKKTIKAAFELPSSKVVENMIKIRLRHQENDLQQGVRTILSDSHVFQEALLMHLDEEALAKFYANDNQNRDLPNM